jgi:hypothetical protein
MIATLWWPSLNPFEPPFPFVLIGYVIALVAIDYCSGLFSLTPEALRKIFVLVTPITTFFLLFHSDANVQGFILVGLHKYRTFPDLTDYLARRSGLSRDKSFCAAGDLKLTPDAISVTSSKLTLN